jgi:hypothetical protein
MSVAGVGEGFPTRGTGDATCWLGMEASKGRHDLTRWISVNARLAWLSVARCRYGRRLHINRVGVSTVISLVCRRPAIRGNLIAI